MMQRTSSDADAYVAQVAKYLILLATPAGLEPATCRLEGGCSIQLSYGALPGAFGSTAPV
jgi:hypothetical protein